MKRYISLMLLIAVVILIVFSVFRETHVVYSLNDNTAAILNGYQFTEAATYDGFMLSRVDGKVYDVYSLTPEVLQQKDCPT